MNMTSTDALSPSARALWAAVWLFGIGSLATSARAQEAEFSGTTLHRIEPPPGGGGDFGGDVYLARETLFVSSDAAHPAGGTGRVFRYGRDAAGVWGLQGELRPSTGTEALRFGRSIFADDNIAVVTASDEVVDESASPPLMGVVYVFERDAGGPGAWGETARIPNPGRSAGDAFGFAMSSDGKYLAIGVTNSTSPGSGHVDVHERIAGGWAYGATLSPGSVPNSIGFGGGLSVSDERISVGDGFSGADRSGRIHVFARDSAGAWSLETLLTPRPSCTSATTCRLSPNARLHKTTLFYSASLSGEIWWETRSSGVWSYRRDITTTATRGVGSWLALAPGLLLASGPHGASEVGEAYLYYQHSPVRGTGWGQVATLRPDHTRTGTGFANVLDVSFTVAAVGAPRDGSGGAVYVYDLLFTGPTDVPAVPPGSRGCGCRIAPTSGENLGGLPLLVLSLAFFVRRSRRR